MIGLLGMFAAAMGWKWLIAVLASVMVFAFGTLAVETTGVIGTPSKRTYLAKAANLKRGYAAVRDTDDNHVNVAGANVAVTGFIEESIVNAEDPISIITAGEFVAKIGAAVTAEQFLITDSSGRLIPTSAAGDNIVAQAVSSGANANDYIVARVCQFVRGANAPVTYYTASGVIPLASGTVALNGAGALAMTLATPTTPGQDGTTITITATTAHAHTVTTAANKIQNANATDDTVTFAHLGDTVVLEAVNGLWLVRYLNGATLSEV